MKYDEWMDYALYELKKQQEQEKLEHELSKADNDYKKSLHYSMSLLEC